MKYQQVKKLVKERAGTKYRGTQLHLLQKLANTLYTEKEENDVEKVVLDRKVSTMCGWVGVGDRQLRNLLKGIAEVTVVRWQDGVISYTMCFDTLKDVETLKSRTKRKAADGRADRAQRGREERAYIHTVNEYHKALGELARSTNILQDQLTRALLDGKKPDIDAEIRLLSALANRNKAAKLAAQYEQVRSDQGRDAAEAMIEQFCKDNPGDPVACEIMRGVSG
jgi:hypothetical protein